MSSDFALPPAAAELGEAVRAYQAAVDDFDRELARLLGVNETDLHCLEILLQDLPEAAPGVLGARLGLSSGAVTPMLDRLERLGYVVRSPDPTDRRRTIVRATPDAARRAGELLGPLIAEGARELLSNYSEEQLQLFTDFMHRSRELQERHVERLRSTTPDAKP